MANSRHLVVPTAPPESGTPSKRGHRHKRSFAISGDFEFLKPPQPAIQNPDITADTTADATADATAYTAADTTAYTTSTVAPAAAPPVPAVSAAASPTRNNSALSPRFFISEESKFSSQYNGVPDAIINLDDALKTRPCTFQSHRRTESAPADLQLPFKVDSSARSLCIEEEIVAEEDSEPDVDDRGRNAEQNHLLSPLRAKSPSPKLLDSRTTNTVPPSSPMHSRRSNYNTLKINKQKERYYNYTKQLPTAGTGTGIGTPSTSLQPQYLSQKASYSSLSSHSALTTSSSTTPSRHVSTPNTPVSPTHKLGRRSPSPTAVHPSFNFESKAYEMPYSKSATPSATNSGDNDTLGECEALPFQRPVPAHRRSKSCVETARPKIDGDGIPQLPEEILLGEPGDAVDLSVTDVITALDIPGPGRDRCVETKSASATPRTHSEVRSVSDSVVDGAQKQKGKKKSRRFRVFSILFSRDKH